MVLSQEPLAKIVPYLLKAIERMDSKWPRNFTISAFDSALNNFITPEKYPLAIILPL